MAYQVDQAANEPIGIKGERTAMHAVGWTDQEGNLSQEMPLKDDPFPIISRIQSDDKLYPHVTWLGVSLSWSRRARLMDDFYANVMLSLTCAKPCYFLKK